MKIKKICVITEQGASCHFADEETEINAELYYATGDPYDCFRVYKNGEMTAEIRCIHNLEIEYGD